MMENRSKDADVCSLCPRACRVDRRVSVGYCRVPDKVRVARAALHFGEEPCISGKNGSGTVFFSGCSLRCVFCQNHVISHDLIGCEITDRKLADLFLSLQDQGAHNLNLVTGTQFLPNILRALELARPALTFPVVWNTGGYETAKTLDRLDGLIDVYLTDLKYHSPELSARYSGTADYFPVASSAALQMVRQVGAPVFENDLLTRGVIIRHLVLPGCRKDSFAVLDWIAEHLPPDSFLISLMSQYTPVGFDPADYPELNRRVTTFEYRSVTDRAVALGLTNGYFQERESAQTVYIPPFSDRL